MNKKNVKKLVGDYLFTPSELKKFQNEINDFEKIINDNVNGEIWKQIKGYEGFYDISNLGRVKSLNRIVKVTNSHIKERSVGERILKGGIVPNGYLTVRLTEKTFYVHALVANNHLIKPNIKNAQVNHKNGIKLDNRMVNLEWVTASDNTKHAFITGLSKKYKGESNGMCKFKDKEIKKIIYLYLKGTKRNIISKKYGISLPQLCEILNNKCRA